MAIKFGRRLVYKYLKCVIAVVVIAFFTQIIIAIFLFPNDNVSDESIINLNPNTEILELKSTKAEIEDGKQIVKPQKSSVSLQVNELRFNLKCSIQSKEAISAINRAKTQDCKKKIADITCMIQNGTFYPKVLPHLCPHRGTFGKYLGCYNDARNARILTNFYGNFSSTNSPELCLNLCIRGGFTYAGVQYGVECFCGDSAPLRYLQTDEAFCDMKCPNNHLKNCGGYLTMNIYDTGLQKFTAKVPKSLDLGDGIPDVKIVFLLTLNGRALRQVHRLINALYRKSHYFYIHVDARQDYLHRMLMSLESKFLNIKLARKRFSTIWGGASLLQMLLASMNEISLLGWKWDFVINLSESDFPIKSLEKLENFLFQNKGLNFVKSYGRDARRFLNKQGLHKTFVECDTHMWRIGERDLPTGIVVDGGSDWVALSPDFISYLLRSPDSLIQGLNTVFANTLLPAESYFHTALRNSVYCNTYVDNNLHVTNWKRSLGCKCQHKHIVDWCGCSPNDFRVEDWPRIQGTQERQLFFARKFEPIISQEIITRIEKYIGMDDHDLVNNLDAYWQSIYEREDVMSSGADLLVSHGHSLVRHIAQLLREEECRLAPGQVLSIHSYHREDVYKGNLILHKVQLNQSVEIILETWYKPKITLTLNKNIEFSENVDEFKVSSDFDQKESTFRNLGNILGPLSAPVLYYKLLAPLQAPENLTVMWVDPSGLIADINQVYVDDKNLTNFVKPDLHLPLLPGIWKVGLIIDSTVIVAQTKFLISPLELFGGKPISNEEKDKVHSGSQSSYKVLSSYFVDDFLPSQEDRVLLNELSLANNKKLDRDLKYWIDSLTYLFYDILGTCVNSISKNTTLKCGERELPACHSTSWSSLSSDPKGHVGHLDVATGRLTRI